MAEQLMGAPSGAHSPAQLDDGANTALAFARAHTPAVANAELVSWTSQVVAGSLY